ncbi:MAG: hypothetical protein V9G08_01615 [Dermatophilaceae bacterium]
MGPASPVPVEVQTELARLAQRWHQLPLRQALSSAGRLRAAAQELADSLVRDAGGATIPLSDLGPACALDQLTVLVYDACVGGRVEGLAERLAVLRRDLTGPQPF